MGRLFVSDYSQIFLPLPIYLLIILALLSIYALKYSNHIIITRIKYLFPALTFWVYVFTTPALGNLLLNELESPYSQLFPEQNNDSSLQNKIIVLSSGFTRHGKTSIETHLDRSAWERIYTGVKLWKQIGGNIYIAGGSSSHDAAPFSVSMKEVAITMGVPESNIFIETKSKNTYGNFYFLTKQYEFKDYKLWLVTSAYHMDRALGVAKHFGLRPTAIACDFKSNEKMNWKAWLPNIEATELYTIALHEIIGKVTYKLRDRSK